MVQQKINVNGELVRLRFKRLRKHDFKRFLRELKFQLKFMMMELCTRCVRLMKRRTKLGRFCPIVVLSIGPGVYPSMYGCRAYKPRKYVPPRVVVQYQLDF